MENYPKHIYPTLLKDADGETFRLQQTCVALQKLENEAKHYEAVRKNINDITIFFLKFLYQLEHFLLYRVHLVLEPLFPVLDSLLVHHWERLG